ncbi:MAG: oligosaccharide flippase family protein [Planctomycetota bacterium]|nr:oligosaccharide flippase family protein [Planctomycetota bacterium]
MNFSWVFTGSIVYNACQFGIFVTLAKFLDVASVGIFTLAFAIVAPIIMFFNLELRGVQATDARNEYNFSDYLALRIITNAIAFWVVIGVCFFSGYDAQTVLVIILVAVAKTVEATSDVIFGLFQKREQMDRIGKSYIIKGLGGLLCLAITIRVTSSLSAGVTALGMWWVLVLLFYDIRNVRRVDSFVPRFHRKTLVGLAWLSMPLGIVMGLISLNTNIPKYFIQSYMGRDALGFFGAMSYIVAGFIQVMSGLGNASVPRLAKYYVHQRGAFVKLFGKLMVIAIVLGVMVLLFSIIFGKRFLAIIYTQAYAAQHSTFVLLSAVCAINFLCFVLGYAMTAVRYFRIQVPLFAVATGASAIACMFLVPTYGLKGAALAMMCSAGIQMVGSILVVTHSLICYDKLPDAEPAAM